ncbi:cytochrome P450 [Patellaria atrata CBS 101060]|uniref:Cytochrome P450 n=1 Tax=Patellaria atrata CBS 101060 TaxID=1346257 RepID=A0A9P4VJ41_9PEZI|nr:cytochrome P450 [Patellaria atrata CBS 101060]
MSLLSLILVTPVTVACSVAAYRLLLHPLSNIPGPKLAAITRLYEFYFDCILAGKFGFQIEQLHKQYGPIMRIGPNEVHISDPDHFETLHNVTNRIDKDQWYYRFVGSQDAGFGTGDADLHRIRRKAMNRFFASSAISNLEPSSREKVQKMCRRLQEMRKDGRPVNLSNAFRCLAADSVTYYCMPQGFNLLDSIDFAEDYNRQARTISYIAVWHRHIPIIFPIFMRMPRWFVKMTFTEGGLLAFDFQTDLARQSASAVHAENRSDISVLDGIINSEFLPESDKTVGRITQEARTLVGAGSETTGSSLEMIAYHVLANPPVFQHLRNELSETVSKFGQNSLTSYSTLQHLPYLTAVINEGLRLSNSVSGRLCRVDHHNAQLYKSYTLPPGTVISMNLRSSHTDPSIFHDPLDFKPDRWLKDTESKMLEKYFIPFGRGSRSCIGKSLAMMNLYLTTANLFFHFVPQLYETTLKDIEMEHDFFAPFPPHESKGLRVILK